MLVQEWGPHKVHIKLGDFGLLGQGKLVKTFYGTVHYLAPEVYTRQIKAEYGPLVDIWSVGVLFLCLEKGKLPHYLPRYEKDSMARAVAIVEFARAYLRA